MSFTDKELKQFKSMNDSPDNGAFTNWFDRDRADALIARLEAAEKVCTDAFNLRNDNHVDCRGGEKCRMGPNVDASLEEWRKAAGK